MTQQLSSWYLLGRMESVCAHEGPCLEWMFGAALLITARNCKEPKCPSGDEWVALANGLSLCDKKGELLRWMIMWMNLRIIMPSGGSQSRRPRITCLHLYYILEKAKLLFCRHQAELPGLRKDSGDWLQRGVGGTVWGDKKLCFWWRWQLHSYKLAKIT